MALVIGHSLKISVLYDHVCPGQRLTRIVRYCSPEGILCISLRGQADKYKQYDYLLHHDPFMLMIQGQRFSLPPIPFAGITRIRF